MKKVRLILPHLTKFNCKIFCFYNNKNKKKKVLINLISNSIHFNTFFNNIDFPILISCRQIVKKNLRNIYGQFYIGPFFVGQGLTIANALRRTLLSEMSCLAITSVQIQNVVHQYQTIRGLQESVFDFLLNLKEIVFKSNKFIELPQIGYLQIQGPCIIRAKDLFLPSIIQCVDPEQYIATLAHDGFLNLKFIIRQGKNSISHRYTGFDTNSLFNRLDFITSYNDKQKSISSLNILNKYFKNLIIDASFNPVIKVNYMIELLDFDQLSFEKQNFLFEFNDNFNIYQKDKINFVTKEIIILEIWTDGSISPVIALKRSIQKLIFIFFKMEKSRILNTVLTHSTISYKKLFTKLTKQYNLAQFKLCQTLYNFQDSKIKNFSEKSFIQKLKYLINQLEVFRNTSN